MKRMKLTNWFTKPQRITKNIYEQIEETIAERERILPEWEKLFSEQRDEAGADIHVQLRETISAFKRSMKQHENFFMADRRKKAA